MPIDEQYPMTHDSWQRATCQGRRSNRPVYSALDDRQLVTCQLRRVNERLDEVQKEVTKSKEETAENLKHKSPFAPEIWDKLVPANFRLLVLESYDGSSDPTEHVAAFRAQMTLYDSFDALMCRVFPAILRGPARMWYDRLKPTSIISFDQLARELEQNFLANAQPKPMATSLLSIAYGREELLAQFINRFATESLAIPDAHPSLVIQAFLMGICMSKLFWSLVEKPRTIVPKMMQRANHFIVAETLIVGKCKEQKRPRTEQPRGCTSGLSRRIKGPDFSCSQPSMTLLNSTRTKIFPPYKGEGALGTTKPHQDPAEERDKGRYCHFYREYDHDTEECRDLKNQIEDLIHQGHLGHYVQR
ncbi:hypothetical protein BHE74_00016721 [Ensete ventricosum]|nr:hypothetical protein BHE74_00016721 [Ensete ventricosum]